jgi:hypothetical protein
MNVWVKVGDSQEHKIRCELSDDIANLKEKIKNKLSITFANIDVHNIIIKDRNGNILKAGARLSTFPLGDSEDNCFLVDAPPVAQGKIAILFIFYCYLFYTFPILLLILPIQL